MEVTDIVSIFLGLIACLGLIITWIRNGRQDVKQRTRMETNLKNEIEEVKGEVKHPEYGLQAIKKAQQKQEVLCARTTANFAARIESLEEKANKSESRRKKTSS